MRPHFGRSLPGGTPEPRRAYAQARADADPRHLAGTNPGRPKTRVPHRWRAVEIAPPATSAICWLSPLRREWELRRPCQFVSDSVSGTCDAIAIGSPAHRAHPPGIPAELAICRNRGDRRPLLRRHRRAGPCHCRTARGSHDARQDRDRDRARRRRRDRSSRTSTAMPKRSPRPARGGRGRASPAPGHTGRIDPCAIVILLPFALPGIAGAFFGRSCSPWRSHSPFPWSRAAVGSGGGQPVWRESAPIVRHLGAHDPVRGARLALGCRRHRTDFLPPMDEGSIIVDCWSPTESPSDPDQCSTRWSGSPLSLPDVENHSRRSGARVFSGPPCRRPRG